LALKGLKRLIDNGKFSNDKSIEDTQKEYEFNSNPIKAFMEDCTEISDYDDCEAISLYFEYVGWCDVHGIKRMANNAFSRKLNNMGYISHRENVPGTNSTKKVTKFDNLKIKKSWLGLDRTESKNVNFLSCPDPSDIEKTEIGQDRNPYVVNYENFITVEYNNSSNVLDHKNNENCVKTKNSQHKDLSCPNMRFSESESHRTGYKDKIETHPVLHQKLINSEQSNENYCLKNMRTSRHLEQN
jgi:putative DNA primase/helicase